MNKTNSNIILKTLIIDSSVDIEEKKKKNMKENK